MSFLDNLENSLNALERVEEKDPAAIARRQAAEQSAKDHARRIAPHAAMLKSSAFTDSLLAACRVLGHQRRTLVQFTWLDSTLRLDAREKRMELRPTPDGVIAVWMQDGTEVHQEAVDFNGSAEALAQRWLEA